MAKTYREGGGPLGGLNAAVMQCDVSAADVAKGKDENSELLDR